MPPSAPGTEPRLLGKAVEENAVTLWRTWSAWEGADCVEEPDRSFVVSDIPDPSFNHLYRIRLERNRAVAFLRACLAPFRKRSVPCFCWIDPAAAHSLRGELQEAGLEYSFTAAGMVLELKNLSAAGKKPDNLEIREVSGKEELRAWCEVISRATPFPPAGERGWLGLHSAIPFGPGEARRHFLARLGGEAVGTASLLFASGVAGLSSVVVLPPYRRRGVGSALSSFALEEALSSGAEAGTLVATAMGAGIYRRLGFREVRRWEGWLWSRCLGESAVI